MYGLLVSVAGGVWQTCGDGYKEGDFVFSSCVCLRLEGFMHKNKEKGGEKNGPKTEAKKPVEFPKSMFSENPLTGSVDRNK